MGMRERGMGRREEGWEEREMESLHMIISQNTIAGEDVCGRGEGFGEGTNMCPVSSILPLILIHPPPHPSHTHPCWHTYFACLPPSPPGTRPLC